MRAGSPVAREEGMKASGGRGSRPAAGARSRSPRRGRRGTRARAEGRARRRTAGRGSAGGPRRPARPPRPSRRGPRAPARSAAYGPRAMIVAARMRGRRRDVDRIGRRERAADGHEDLGPRTVAPVRRGPGRRVAEPVAGRDRGHRPRGRRRPDRRRRRPRPWRRPASARWSRTTTSATSRSPAMDTLMSSAAEPRSTSRRSASSAARRASRTAARSAPPETIRSISARPTPRSRRATIRRISGSWAGGVVAVAGRGVDPDRPEDPEPVVVAQHLGRHAARARRTGDPEHAAMHTALTLTFGEG